MTLVRHELPCFDASHPSAIAGSSFLITTVAPAADGAFTFARLSSNPTAYRPSVKDDAFLLSLSACNTMRGVHQQIFRGSGQTPGLQATKFASCCGAQQFSHRFRAEGFWSLLNLSPSPRLPRPRDHKLVGQTKNWVRSLRPSSKASSPILHLFMAPTTLTAARKSGSSGLTWQLHIALPADSASMRAL